MRNTFGKYTPHEILNILQEENRLLSCLDPEVERMEITPDMRIKEWRTCLDLLDWKRLYAAMNEKFNINVSWQDWKKTVLPEKHKTVWEMCLFVSGYANKEIIAPAKLLGSECLDAGVFLTLKNNLSQRGLDVKNVGPSTLLRDFGRENKKNWPCLLWEVILTGVKAFDSLRVQYRKCFFGIFPVASYIDTDPIKTFGDLAKKIAEGLSTNERLLTT